MLRFLGFVFVLLLLLAGTAWLRGWFTISTVDAGGKTGITVAVDSDKVRSDASKARETLGQLSQKAAEKIKSLAKRTTESESVVEGDLVVVDAAAGTVELTTDGQRIELRVGAGVPVRRGGVDIGLAGLAAGARVRVTFAERDEVLRVTSIETVE